MKKNKRILKLLKSDCGQCSSCCRDLQVEVTDSDIARLLEYSDIPAYKLVRLYSTAEVESDEESDWIKLSYGKRSMGLNKKRNGKCIFLSNDKTCGEYKARPMTCRIFPFCVVSDDEDRMIDLEISEVILDKTIRCKRTKGNGSPYKSFMLTARQAQKEYEIYKEKVNAWNNLSAKGVKNDFLRFLGFNTPNNGHNR